MTSALNFLRYSTAHGLSLVREITEEVGLEEVAYVHLSDFGVACARILNLWTSLTHSLKNQNKGVVITVDKGTCYVGTRMMLFNPNGSENDFHIICLDEGFGFHTTACAVSQAGYVGSDGPGTRITDDHARIEDWRLISKQFQDPTIGDITHSRIGRLLHALQDSKYQQPIGARMRASNRQQRRAQGGADTVVRNGARWFNAPVVVMCNQTPGNRGGHEGCRLVADHQGAHEVPAGTRTNPRIEFVQRSGIAGLSDCSAVRASQIDSMARAAIDIAQAAQQHQQQPAAAADGAVPPAPERTNSVSAAATALTALAAATMAMAPMLAAATEPAPAPAPAAAASSSNSNPIAAVLAVDDDNLDNVIEALNQRKAAKRLREEQARAAELQRLEDEEEDDRLTVWF